jgi:hypothetical protein
MRGIPHRATKVAFARDIVKHCGPMGVRASERAHAGTAKSRNTFQPDTFSGTRSEHISYMFLKRQTFPEGASEVFLEGARHVFRDLVDSGLSAGEEL